MQENYQENYPGHSYTRWSEVIWDDAAYDPGMGRGRPGSHGYCRTWNAKSSEPGVQCLQEKTAATFLKKYARWAFSEMSPVFEFVSDTLLPCGNMGSTPTELEANIAP